jgi:hypothetical protein
VELRADLRRPFVHADQAVMADGYRFEIVESRAVVFHGQLEMALGAVKRDSQVSRTRMFNRIQYRFLRDSQQVVLDIRRQIALTVGEIQLQAKTAGLGQLASGLSNSDG